MNLKKGIFFKEQLIKSLTDFKFRTTDYVYPTITINSLLVLFQTIYLLLRFRYINDLIPLWYSQPWGLSQLAGKKYIFLIPITSLAIALGGAALIFLLKKYFVRYSGEILFAAVTFCNAFLTYSLIRIVFIASVPFDPLVNPTYLALAPAFATAFLFSIVFTPRFISWAKKHGVITIPTFHSHPGMILTKPSARGAGVAFTLVFLVTAIAFVPVSKEFMGIFVSVFLLAMLGMFDDFQNTHPTSKLRVLEHPILRLLALFSIVSITVLAGVKINVLTGPFGGLFDVSKYQLFLGNAQLSPLALILSIVWIVWLLNVLSWSNGVDGQYGGIIAIAGIFIAALALRFEAILPIHRQVATLAAILSGASLGVTIFTWHPSRIMWGFSAMSAGLVLSALAILINAKVATSVMIILIPFLDGAVTFLRRILQGRNPLKGDRGHLHHLLMKRGWSVPAIATFYWFSTAVFGLVAIFSSETVIPRVALILGGVVASFIILLNLRNVLIKPQEV